MGGPTIAAVTTILLARHGETDWNRAQRWQGHADRPLTGLGRAQAHALALRCDEFPLTAVYSSDLARARETARVVAERRGLALVERRDLREVDCGSWSGRCSNDIDPAEIERWKAGEKAWAGGETYEEMAARIVRAVREIGAERPGETVLVVSHGAAIRAVHAHAAGLAFHEYRLRHPTVTNGRLSAVAVVEGAFRDLGTLPNGPVPSASENASDDAPEEVSEEVSEDPPEQ
jgi:broad specificity phosphatase PhoE